MIDCLASEGGRIVASSALNCRLLDEPGSPELTDQSVKVAFAQSVAIKQGERRTGTAVDQLDDESKRAVVVGCCQQAANRGIDRCGRRDQWRFAVDDAELVVVNILLGAGLGVPNETRIAGAFDEQILRAIGVDDGLHSTAEKVPTELAVVLYSASAVSAVSAVSCDCL